MVEVFGQSLPILLLILGVVLAIAEALAPGAHLVVLGVALIVAGLVGLALSTVIGSSVLLTGLLALTILVTGTLALIAYRELDIYGGKGVGQTMSSDSLRGSTGRVTEPVTPTDGEIKLDGGGFNPYYQARCISGTIPEGAEVIVVDPGGGNVLTVESLAAAPDEIDRQLALGREEGLEEETET